MPLADGDEYAGFQISGLLGAGGTGTVYVATDPRTGDRVALKILRTGPSSDETFRQHLIQTSESLIRLRIPGAARIIDFGELRGRLWVATEYIPGTDTDTLLHQHFPTGVPHRSLCVIADQVAHTLDAAHAARLLHRDVKPTNIIVDDPFSAHYRLVLTDFGHGITDTSTKPFRYAAPELLSGHRPGPRSDQFALAASVFHLLTGRPAFDNANRTASGRPPAVRRGRAGRRTGRTGRVAGGVRPRLRNRPAASIRLLRSIRRRIPQSGPTLGARTAIDRNTKYHGGGSHRTR